MPIWTLGSHWGPGLQMQGAIFPVVKCEPSPAVYRAPMTQQGSRTTHLIQVPSRCIPTYPQFSPFFFLEQCGNEFSLLRIANILNEHERSFRIVVESIVRESTATTVSCIVSWEKRSVQRASTRVCKIRTTRRSWSNVKPRKNGKRNEQRND